MKRVYLDNNATTKLDPLVKMKMQPFFEDLYGNPNSLHQYGMEVRPYLNEAMGYMYDALGAPDPDDILITSCATESNNTVLKGVFFKHILKDPAKNHIIASAVEHPSVLETLHFLEENGAEITFVDVDENSYVSSERMASAITDKTILISMMWANNETGMIFPIEEVAAIAKERGILFDTDAVQAIGKVAIDLTKTPIDYLTFSAHKFHGPKGIGGLYVRKGSELPNPAWRGTNGRQACRNSQRRLHHRNESGDETIGRTFGEDEQRCARPPRPSRRCVGKNPGDHHRRKPRPPYAEHHPHLYSRYRRGSDAVGSQPCRDRGIYGKRVCLRVTRS